MHSHGIKVLGSTILGLEHHTPENIQEEIEHAVAHETDFHRFMLYTPAPGTPLYLEMLSQGRMLDGIEGADIHGQDKFNFRHAAIAREDSKHWLDWTFRRDFERNGPSLYRICRTTLEGCRRYKDHPDRRVRERFEWEVRWSRNVHGALLWAMEHSLKNINQTVTAQIRTLRQDVGREFGLVSRLAGRLPGRFLLWTTIREERRLARGVTYEPEPITERRNWLSAEAPPGMEGILQGGAVPAPMPEPR